MNSFFYMPHIHCLGNDPYLVSQFLISDLIVGTGYWVFCILLYMGMKSKDFISSSNYFFISLIGVFFFCGLDRYLNVINIYNTYYHIQAIVKDVLAFAILSTIYFSMKDFNLINKIKTEEEVDELLNKMSQFKESLHHFEQTHGTKSQYFTELMEKLPIRAAGFDGEMNYIFATKEWKKAYNTPEDIIGRNHYEVFPEILYDKREWIKFHERTAAGEVCESKLDEFRGEYFSWILMPWNTVAPNGQIHIAHDLTESIRKFKEQNNA